MIHLTLYYTPGILTSFHHLIANADFLCAANYGKWQMTLQKQLILLYV